MALAVDRPVYVVAKAPRPGVSKTRLCPPLSPEQAAELARAFLLDTLATVAAAGLLPRIVCRDAAEAEALRGLVPASTRIHTQAGDGLGAALEDAFRDGLSAAAATNGCPAAAVLGADSPTVEPATLRQAFARLEEGASDVALGPTDDGGYYLLAARQVHPWLFRDMPWSTSTVAGETLRRCRERAVRVELLPTCFDVDDGATLARLRRELADLPSGLACHTRGVLARLPG